METTIEIYEKVFEFFDYDLPKAITWMYTCNPNLGNATPMFMILSGRQDKLLEWVDEQLGIESV